MRHYIRYRCWDWILCILISIGMAVNLLSGFEIDDVTDRLPILIIVALAVTTICFAFAINRTAAISGIMIAVAALIMLIIAVHGKEVFRNDKENALIIFFAVIVICALVVFLVCRSRLGIILLFLIGNAIQAGAAFLQFPCEMWAYILFLAGTGLLLFYRVYVISLKKAHVGKVRFKGFMLQNVCMCLAAFLVAGAIFGAIIRPLNPPTDELKLIQKLESFEVLERIGVATTKVLPNSDIQSQQIPDEQLATDLMNDQLDAQSNVGGEEDTTDDTWEGNTIDTMANQTEDANAISYSMSSHWYVWIILAAAIVFFVIRMRKYLRKRWMAQVENLSRSDGVINLYAYFLRGLKRAGCAKAPNLTLTEYQSLNENTLHKFDVGDVTFAGLTEVYKKAYYGDAVVSEEEFADFRTYYEAFRNNLCNVTGKLKYIVVFFTV